MDDHNSLLSRRVDPRELTSGRRLPGLLPGASSAYRGEWRYNPRMAQNEESPGLLSGRPAPKEERSLAPWIVAGAVVLLIAAVLVVVGLRSKASAAGSGQPDAYAAQIALTGITLSQSSNMAGSQITYVDGEVVNNGNRTVTGITVLTVFLDNAGQPGKAERAPLSLIRTRDPYIDIEPVSADPLPPGGRKPFRLIFDHVPAEWNQQNPQIRIQQVEVK